MRRTMVMTLLLGMVLTASGVHAAWDTAFEADVMPNDPSLGSGIWNLAAGCDYSQTSTADGILHLRDPWLTRNAYYIRETSIPAGTPLTVETRVRIASGASNYPYIGPATLGVTEPRSSSSTCE